MSEPITAAGYVELEPEFVERWTWYVYSDLESIRNGFVFMSYSGKQDALDNRPAFKHGALVRVMIPLDHLKRSYGQ